MPVNEEIKKFTEEVLKTISNTTDPDITLFVFRAIKNNPKFFKEYQNLVGAKSRDTVHNHVGKSVKEILGRENDIVVSVKGELIGSYTRFKSQ